ncbi:unnamed protein product [Microthlaspi erraticum]|uniref:F-box domain-containing protein n=1 Tax=Microthlaspi erraticum TaxID=1685480 RepID=A0A6D2JHU3_9BRAS|nr:unnamed protein product [Microthlaspi erraticum]
MKTRRKLGRIRRQGRRDICESHDRDQSLEIPFDLVIETLTRLPAKSLMRFKSVTKLWSSLICSQYFTNRFLNVSSSPPRLYMMLGLGNNNVLLSSSASPNSDRTTMHSFVVDQDLTTSGMEDFSVSHVFRGFICFVNGASAKIYNTSTRQLVALPDIE